MQRKIPNDCIALIATLVTVFVGCGDQPVIVESTFMNDAERDGLLAVQAKLDETLRKHSPFVFDELAPPASVAEIQKLRAELDGANRPYLALWFKWHDGCKKHPVGILPLGEMISIEQSIADRRGIQDVPFVERRRKRDVKIMEDGSGDGFFADLSTSPPQIYYYMLEDPFPREYGTMLQFLQFIDRVHSTGIASVNERGIVVFDETTYQKLEDEHLASLSNGGG